jgi:Gp37 protein
VVILAVEQLIVAQLQAALPDVPVLPFPTDPAELGRAVNAKQIYVGFKSKSLDNPSSSLIGGRAPPQRSTLQYELILRMQELRSHQVTYPVMEQIEQALIGFRPDIGTERHLLTTAFVDFGSGLWLYSMTFAIETVFTSQTQPSWGKPISY